MYLGQLSEGKTALNYYNKGISILNEMKTQKVIFKNFFFNKSLTLRLQFFHQKRLKIT